MNEKPHKRLIDANAQTTQPRTMTDSQPSPLSSDRPGTDPANDLFGHASFAKTLAGAISRYQSPDGIVLALYGPWGSGKSTVLAFIEHELDSQPPDVRPVMVPFNPWWFSGHENLAKAFLGQLQVVLPTKYGPFKALANKLADFAGALGGAADVAGAAFGFPIGGKTVEAGAKLLASKPKDVPGLKKELSKLLLESRKRVLVVIDDIDRLAPDEIRQLFTVIKALADFPFVTYLLAFDREVAAAAISEQTGLPGDRFLEKIVQVPFELPRVDRTQLRQALFSKLDAVMVGTPEGAFDSAHWSNVFHSGLDPLFTVPRDVVRLTNALSVTYPPVAGEVNPVDFIAVECFRVFLPRVYDVIRSAPDDFTGYSAPGNGDSKQQALEFHERWLKEVPDRVRSEIKELMQRLFPRLESVWSNMHYSADSAREWRRQLRVCSPDVFSAYFRLSLPLGAVSRSEIHAALASAKDSNSFGEVLRAAAQQKTSTGVSKVRGLLERLMDHVQEEFLDSHAQPVIQALFSVGDTLLLGSDRLPGEFDFGNESRIARLAYHLLKKVEENARAPLLLQALTDGEAIRCSQYLLGSLIEEAEKASLGKGVSLLSMPDAEYLKHAWRKRVLELSKKSSFIDHPTLGSVLSVWRHWGGEKDAEEWWAKASADDEALLKLVSAFKYEVTSQGFGDHAFRITLRVNLKELAEYGDLAEMATRVRIALEECRVPDVLEPPARQFLKEWSAVQSGKHLDDE